MSNVYFDRRMQGQNPGQTLGPNGEQIYYIVYQINGLGEPVAFQVDWESHADRDSITFEGTNHIERNGTHYYLK
ncbi:hypothetical protein ACFQ38_09360 [Sporosarcina contaminans]|uniref:Uncharacterized protein n=1 Tax=Sporosarcina contaminans TaxID=633403 RepID=A0ABW3TX43_9BACL